MNNFFKSLHFQNDISDSVVEKINTSSKNKIFSYNNKDEVFLTRKMRTFLHETFLAKSEDMYNFLTFYRTVEAISFCFRQFFDTFREVNAWCISSENSPKR